MEDERNGLRRDLDESRATREDLLTKSESWRQRADKLASENEEVKMERDDCDKMRLEAIKKHDGQLKALNANLAQLRVDLKQQVDKCAQLEIECNVARGTNLELDAKLSNCQDERNQLLERCMHAEKMCESFKLQSIEAKRRHEESEAALQELAREHQTLQVRLHFLFSLSSCSKLWF